MKREKKLLGKERREEKGQERERRNDGMEEIEIGKKGH